MLKYFQDLNIAKGRRAQDLPLPPDWELHGVYFVEVGDAGLEVYNRFTLMRADVPEDFASYGVASLKIIDNYSEERAQLSAPGHKVEPLTLLRILPTKYLGGVPKMDEKDEAPEQKSDHGDSDSVVAGGMAPPVDTTEHVEPEIQVPAEPLKQARKARKPKAGGCSNVQASTVGSTSGSGNTSVGNAGSMAALCDKRSDQLSPMAITQPKPQIGIASFFKKAIKSEQIAEPQCVTTCAVDDDDDDDDLFSAAFEKLAAEEVPSVDPPGQDLPSATTSVQVASGSKVSKKRKEAGASAPRPKKVKAE